MSAYSNYFDAEEAAFIQKRIKMYLADKWNTLGAEAQQDAMAGWKLEYKQLLLQQQQEVYLNFQENIFHNGCLVRYDEAFDFIYKKHGIKVFLEYFVKKLLRKI